VSIPSLVRRFGRTVTLGYRSNAAGAAGGVVVSFTNTATATAWIQPASSQELDAWGCTRGRNGYSVFFPGAVTVDTDDRITVSIDGESRVLDVVGVVHPGELARGALRHTKVIAQETLPRP